MDFTKLSSNELEKILPKDKILESINIIEKMLELSKNPYIALSFGKDSLVLLDLVYKINHNIKCIFLKSEESFLMYNFEEVINWYLVNKNLNLHIVDTKRLSETNFDWFEARHKGNQDFLLDDFFNGYDGFFMGIRIQESKARKMTLLQSQNNKISKFIMQYKTGKREGMYRCCPLAKWTADEIMIYLLAKKLKFLDIYNLGSHIRTTARITSSSVLNNSLFWIKKNNPQNYNKLCQLLPILKDAKGFL